MQPIVLILSYGSMKPESLAKDIVAGNKGKELEEKVTFDGKDYSVQNCKIQNKYFETEIHLLPFEGTIELVPKEILTATEGLIVFFDSEDRSFLAKIRELNACVQSNNIELGMLVTTDLCDDSAVGLTFAEIKGTCQPHFDLTELCSNSEEEANENDSPPSNDMDDILEALRNHVWSNVMNAGENASSEEQELEAFESLLSSLMEFKRTSTNMSKDELLDEAEKLAERFADLLNDD